MEALRHIRVMIADDHLLFREGIRLILSAEEGIKIVGEAPNGLQMIDVLAKIQPDVLLLGINVPGMNGIESLMSIKQETPQTKSLILATPIDEASIFRALNAGAKGYLSKDAKVCDLIKAIRAIHDGELWVERKLIARFVEREPTAEVGREDRPGRTQVALTSREQEILRVLASGGTNKEIGQALFISEKTVKCHLNNILGLCT